jgi:hypothetical protein
MGLCRLIKSFGVDALEEEKSLRKVDNKEAESLLAQWRKRFEAELARAHDANAEHVVALTLKEEILAQSKIEADNDTDDEEEEEEAEQGNARSSSRSRRAAKPKPSTRRRGAKRSRNDDDDDDNDDDDDDDDDNTSNDDLTRSLAPH